MAESLGDAERRFREEQRRVRVPPPPLDELKAFIRQYVVVDDHALVFLALWCTHTLCFEAATVTAYVRVTSAERASGKSRLLEVLSLLTRRSWLAVNPSTAVVFRKGDSDAPTLLLDEIDQMPFGDRRDLLSVLNSGYRIGVKVPRCDDQGRVHEFDPFFPKVFSGLEDGKLPDTLRSRSVLVRLERRRKDEPIKRFRHRTAEPEAEPLVQAMVAWAAANLEPLADAEPDVPDELGDREAEVLEPLAAIADLVGGTWPKRAREAAVALARRKGEDDDSRGTRLLEDIRQAFAERANPEAIFSADLVDELNGFEEAGWGGWHKGAGFKTRDLARLLRPFHISPQKLRIGDGVRQGYRREQFEDRWVRYLRNIGTSGTNRALEPHSDRHLERDVPEVPGHQDALALDPDELECGHLGPPVPTAHGWRCPICNAYVDRGSG